MGTLVRKSVGAIILLVVMGVVAYDAFITTSVSHQTFVVDFTRGTRLSEDADGMLQKVASIMKGDPDWVAHVTGHTETGGDEQANVTLSERRAVTVKQALTDRGVADNRITTAGAGGAAPLEKKDGEADSAYRRRLSRSEIVLEKQ